MAASDGASHALLQVESLIGGIAATSGGVRRDSSRAEV
jgi:hypothetical protein